MITTITREPGEPCLPRTPGARTFAGACGPFHLPPQAGMGAQAHSTVRRKGPAIWRGPGSERECGRLATSAAAAAPVTSAAPANHWGAFALSALLDGPHLQNGLA